MKKQTHQVVDTRHGNICSRHISEAHAIKAAGRLQAMSNGKLPVGTFKVKAIDKV